MASIITRQRLRWLGFGERVPGLALSDSRSGGGSPDSPPEPRAASDRIVIAGGGFAGLYTALALAARRHHPPVLLIEPNERFVFLPLLYELLSGELRRWEIAPPYAALLAGRGVALLQDRVVKVDTTARRLQTATGRRLAYGRLVLATGARGETFGVEGADRHALGFRNLNDVDRLASLVRELGRPPGHGGRLAVVGAGASGVELACKLADLLAGQAGIELIEQGSTALPQARAFNREQGLRALERRQVRLRLHTTVTAVGADRLLLRHGGAGAGGRDADDTLPVAATIWTAGLRMQPPLLEPEPPRDRLGRLRCRPDLRLEGLEEVFAAGDGALVPADPDDPAAGALPPNAQVAFQQAPLLASNLLRSLAGEPLEPFRFRDLGEMLSLGRGEASLSSGGITLAGPLAFQLRRLAYLTRLPGRQQQLRVAAGWLAEGSA
jgi:NADH dehydrogenase